MKLPITAAVLLAGAALTQAQVPGLINYQGRLTTPSGAPASGTKNFSISIYDAETGGNLLYTEAVGPVTLDSAGVYSFQFGTTGTSNTQVTETLATTDGSAASFQKILANTGVVAGTLSVTDGTYTWSQSAGSSSEDDFGVAYSSSLRRVTVTYFNGAPVAGKAITAAYKYATSGITGAISSGSQHWMAISIDGVSQAGRQRVLAVPFAMQAGHAVTAVEAERLKEKVKLWRPENYKGNFRLYNNLNSSVNDTIFFPMSFPYKITPEMNYGFDVVSGISRIPSTFQKLKSFRLSAKLARNSSGYANLSAEVVRYNPFDISDSATIVRVDRSSAANQGDPATAVVNVDFSRDIDVSMDNKYIYEIHFFIVSLTTAAPTSEITDLSFLVIE